MVIAVLRWDGALDSITHEKDLELKKETTNPGRMMRKDSLLTHMGPLPRTRVNAVEDRMLCFTQSLFSIDSWDT